MRTLSCLTKLVASSQGCYKCMSCVTLGVHSRLPTWWASTSKKRITKRIIFLFITKCKKSKILWGNFSNSNLMKYFAKLILIWVTWIYLYWVELYLLWLRIYFLIFIFTHYLPNMLKYKTICCVKEALKNFIVF